MAIDNKAKRSSVQAYTVGLMRPPPDGTVSEGDRAEVTWLYQGLDYNAPILGTSIGWFLDFRSFLTNSFKGGFH